MIAALDGRAWSGDEVAALRHVAGQVRQFLDAQAARREVLRHLALDGLITSASARLVEAEDPDRELVTTNGSCRRRIAGRPHRLSNRRRRSRPST